MAILKSPFALQGTVSDDTFNPVSGLTGSSHHAKFKRPRVGVARHQKASYHQKPLLTLCLPADDTKAIYDCTGGGITRKQVKRTHHFVFVMARHFRAHARAQPHKR